MVNISFIDVFIVFTSHSEFHADAASGKRFYSLIHTALISVVLSQCTPNLLKIYVSTNNSYNLSHIRFQKKLSYEDTFMHGSQACSFSVLFGRVVYIRKSGLASIILGYHSTIFHPPSRSIFPLPGSELWESCLKSASVKHKEEKD